MPKSFSFRMSLAPGAFAILGLARCSPRSAAGEVRLPWSTGSGNTSVRLKEREFRRRGEWARLEDIERNIRSATLSQ